jgi:hypothetical protein
MGLFEKDMLCLIQGSRKIIIERGKKYLFRVEYAIPMLLKIRDNQGLLFLDINGLGELKAKVNEVEPNETGIKITGAFPYQQDKDSTELTVSFEALIDYAGQNGWIMISKL